jgi:hypothetical protein
VHVTAEREQREHCVHCGRAVAFGIVVADEWSHSNGNTWCQDAGGFTATPLRRATPLYHGPEDVL